MLNEKTWISSLKDLLRKLDFILETLSEEGYSNLHEAKFEISEAKRYFSMIETSETFDKISFSADAVLTFCHSALEYILASIVINNGELSTAQD